jgi:hypothetical protein
LRCPFGCRQHHRKQRSNQRSTAYYQTDSGKRKKKRLNAKRSGTPGSVECVPLKRSAPGPPPNELPQKVELLLEGAVLDELAVKTSPTLPYLRMVINLLEGVQLSLTELVACLLSTMRQHCMAYRTRTDYVLRFLHQHPP